MSHTKHVDPGGLAIVLRGAADPAVLDELAHRFRVPVFRAGQALPDEVQVAWVLDASLVLPPGIEAVLARALPLLESEGAIALPGNHVDHLDPLAGLDLNGLDPARVLAWCSEDLAQHVVDVPLRCVLLRVQGGRLPAKIDRALLIDDGYVIDPERPVPSSGKAARNAPLGHLAASAARLAAEDLTALPDPLAHGTGATVLHLTHGWGGGVWRWIQDLVHTDRDHRHLVLVAESEPSGAIAGTRLKLCVSGPGRAVVRDLPLDPPIRSIDTGHAGYARVLQAVIERYDVSRIVISSAVGHSLDGLCTGLPTLVMLHDFFPLWPLLDLDPLTYLRRTDMNPRAARELALREHADLMRFVPADCSHWNRIADAFKSAISSPDVSLAAPTRHVTERWRALLEDPGHPIALIPHGFRPAWSESRSARERRRNSGRRLHLVVPGRLSEGKGRELLRQALPELSRYARITALGCGHPGMALLGVGGVDLIPEYRPEQLPDLMARLEPDAALFLSTVPETWNYTLSEMRALGLPPIATRLGSFVERIRDGVDGWLFEPTAEALIDCVRALAHNPDSLEQAKRALPPERGCEDAVRDLWDTLESIQSTAAAPASREFRVVDGERLARIVIEADHARGRQRLRVMEHELGEAAAELDRRARWARTLERLAEERTRWARSLDRELGEVREQLARTAAENARLSETAASLEQQLESVTQHRDLLEARLHEIVHSRSWRWTRPFRVMLRILKSGRFRRLANPLRWPRMLGRLIGSVRRRGLIGTLQALQYSGEADALPAAVPAAEDPMEQPVADPVAYRDPERPLVSVIVPVYNQLPHTAHCLNSLVEVGAKRSFEIIVVDDASGDETPDWLARCTGIRVLRNEHNTGFIGACNRGAEAASGQWLVFLNNDTEVRAGWLDALIDTFDRHPDAGIVGARLVFGDGSLQEAGGIVFSDGSGWNFGRGADPALPPFNVVSEADYVSGACLAISRALFLELGGFDRSYAPAYYEDTDLCFKVRHQKGLKVWYQPAATVVHFEGVSSGTDEHSGVKRHQAINRKRFADRWSTVLRDYPENPQQYSLPLAEQFRFRRYRRQALVIDAETPKPDQDSGSVRMFALLEILRDLGFRTRFMPENLAREGEYTRALQQAGIEVLTRPPIDGLEQWLSEYGDQLDLVLVSRHYVLSPVIDRIRRRCPRAKLVFDTVDLHFLREQREAELKASKSALKAARMTRAQELRLIGAADATLVVSEFERQLLGDLVPDAEVAVVSNIHRLQDPGRPFGQRRDLVFIGGFRHPPNVDAAEWLIDEILPRIRAELDEVELHLIGSNMPESLLGRRAPGLRIHGFVRDLTPFMTGCRVSVAPLRYGAGVKGKVNQAMSQGLPVVATPCAAEGMHVTDGMDILLAESADEFAAQVVRVYRDRALWQRLAEGGRANVARHFSVDAARHALASLFERIGLAGADSGEVAAIDGSQSAAAGRRLG
ncbi:MAG: hypothetical protein Kow0020_13200 [Wenzhouxiangellaceae bacterium]